MQTIKLLSAVTPIAITQANFPSLQHAWTAANVTATSVVDQIGDCDLNCAGGVVVANNKFSFSGANRAISGTLFVPGQRDLLIINCGTQTAVTDSWTFGNIVGTDGSYLQLSADEGYIGLDADQYITLAAGVVPITDGAMVHAYDNSAAAAACATRYIINDAAITPVTGSDSTPTFGTNVNLPAMAQTWSTPNTAATWSGAFIWAFPSGELPSASFIQMAAAWMAKNPGEVYPGLLGK